MSPITKKILIFIAVILVLICGVYFAVIWHRFLRDPIFSDHSFVTVQIPEGQSVEVIAHELHERGLMRYPRLFAFLARLNGDASVLKAGEYQIKFGMTPPELLADIVAGKVVERSITLIEGKTFQQIKALFNQNPYLKHDIKQLSDADIMKALGQPNQFPEGVFFPATYYFTWGTSDLSLLKQAYKKMQSVLNSEWNLRAPGLSYQNAYEALIVASLLEKESAIPEERAKIAGVILRRLQKRMRLQIDPTAIYGLDLSHRQITRSDLNRDSPYNTYRHFGLPPTPIAMPSRSSIFAALHPMPGNALYYMATGDGSHVFSASYAEHRRAVEKYRLLTTAKTLSKNLIPFLFKSPTMCRTEVPYIKPIDCHQG